MTKLETNCINDTINTNHNSNECDDIESISLKRLSEIIYYGLNKPEEHYKFEKYINCEVDIFISLEFPEIQKFGVLKIKDNFIDKLQYTNFMLYSVLIELDKNPIHNDSEHGKIIEQWCMDSVKNITQNKKNIPFPIFRWFIIIQDQKYKSRIKSQNDSYTTTNNDYDSGPDYDQLDETNEFDKELDIALKKFQNLETIDETELENELKKLEKTNYITNYQPNYDLNDNDLTDLD